MFDKKNKKPGFGAGLAAGAVVGAAAGAAAGALLTPKSGKENRKEAAKAIHNLTQKVGGEDIERQVKKVFGEGTDEARKLYREASHDIQKKLKEVQNGDAAITIEKYRKIADEAVKNLKTDSKKMASRFNNLRDHFVSEYSHEFKKHAGRAN